MSAIDSELLCLSDILRICGCDSGTVKIDNMDGYVKCKHPLNKEGYCSSHCPIIKKARELSHNELKRQIDEITDGTKSGS